MTNKTGGKTKEENIGAIKAWLVDMQNEGRSGIIRIDYSGYGDSMNEINCDMEIPVDIEDALFGIHPSPGFWNGDGGQGCMILNIDDLSIKIEHEDNITEVEYTEVSY